MFHPLKIAALSGTLFAAACSSQPPIKTVEYVDLERFMGDWYVIANIPTFVEKGAHNAIESYRLDDDGTIATTFTFRADSFDGPEKEYNPRGFVRDTESNATWGMQFVWPFKGEFLISYLAEDYGQTIISRTKRDYVWILARTPQISEDVYQDMLAHVEQLGYDMSEIQLVPQRWPEQAP